MGETEVLTLEWLVECTKFRIRIKRSCWWRVAYVVTKDLAGSSPEANPFAFVRTSVFDLAMYDLLWTRGGGRCF
jgi:hypothetical protein